LADFLCLIDRGMFLQCGPKELVFHRPANLEIARSMGIFNLAPARIEALDPSEGSSRLKVLGHELCGPYLPGHLLGDQGYLCVRQSEVAVYAPQTAKSPLNQLALKVVGVTSSPRGIRIEFENEFVALMSEADYQLLRDKERLTLYIPEGAIYFIGK